MALMLASAVTMVACSEKEAEPTSSTTDSIQEMAADLAEKTTDVVESATEKAADVAEVVQEKTADAVDATVETTAEVTETVVEKTKETAKVVAEKTEVVAEKAVETTAKVTDKVVEKAKEVKEAAVEKVKTTINKDEMLALANSSGCMACHKVDQKVMGPSFNDIAAKYAGQSGAKEGLINSIAHGSTGKWGSMPMPANSPRVSDENIAKLAEFVLSLK